MRIQITDRAAWLSRVTAAIERIERSRAREDAEYEARWRKSLWGRFMALFGINKPEVDFPVYPTMRGWRTLSTLELMKRALESKDTGELYFTNEELEAVE